MKREQPVLVGTTSIETSELLSGVLKENGIPHEVLNAKQHEREAHIVEKAGMPGKVTIATNMAGRGTDIMLGGNNEAELEQAAAAAGEAGLDEVTAARIRADWQERHDKVVAAGGLHIVGTERHESRRIDNQLRGRSGRQGDPGSSRFYLSMEDNLMRIFGDPNRTKQWLAMAGMKEGEVIESGMLTRQIEKAQRKVEAHNFDIRKQLLTFDDVANDQRKVIYQQRTELMGADDLADAIARHPRRSGRRLLDQHHARRTSSHEEWDLDGLAAGDREEFRARRSIRRSGSRTSRSSRNRRCAAASIGADRRDVRSQGRSASGAPHHAARREGHHAARARPAVARSPRRAWTTCARASTCAATRRRTIASSTSARPSSCSPRCSTASSSTP